jgi:hypothetical protein
MIEHTNIETIINEFATKNACRKCFVSMLILNKKNKCLLGIQFFYKLAVRPKL